MRRGRSPRRCASAPVDPFDLILIVPIGIEDGSAPEVWLLHGAATATSPDALARIEPLHGLLGAVFDGLARPVGVFDDLWVAGLAAQYEMKGWLR